MKSLSVLIFSLPMTMFFFVRDFLAYGNAALGILDLIKQSGANLVGNGLYYRKSLSKTAVKYWKTRR